MMAKVLFQAGMYNKAFSWFSFMQNSALMSQITATYTMLTALRSYDNLIGLVTSLGRSGLMHPKADDSYRSLQQYLRDCLDKDNADYAIASLIKERLPLLDAFFGGARNPAKKTVSFVRDYITLAPDYFAALNTLSEMDNIITYTCLLYTSPSPRDRTRSRMPSSA